MSLLKRQLNVKTVYRSMPLSSHICSYLSVKQLMIRLSQEVYYKRYVQKLNPSMRQIHVAGEKLFVDYSGVTIPIHNQKTGEIDKAQVFVAVLGASGSPMVEDDTTNLFEIIEDRTNINSTIITSQLPVSEWYSYLNNNTIADAILDRIAYSSHRVELHGESMRKLNAVMKNTQY
jgi:hypothetical protein